MANERSKPTDSPEGGDGVPPGAAWGGRTQPIEDGVGGGAPEPRTQRDFSGEVIEDRYELARRLGVGGMGVVYLADDRLLKRKVVVKFPSQEVIDDPRFRLRFSDEIGRVIALEHPHVVKLFDVGKLHGLPFLMMQYLPGGSLEDRISALGRRQTPREVLSWLRDIAGALDFVHERGFTHRDVKPGNILFDERGHAFLGDFGIAQVLGDAQVARVKEGSPWFCAPEIRDAARIGPAYDQYSLAVVVHQVLSGRPPHVADDATQLLRIKAEEPPRSLLGVVPDLPAESAQAVLRALSAKPAERHASCGEFVIAFARAVGRSSSREAAAPAAPAADGAHGAHGAPSAVASAQAAVGSSLAAAVAAVAAALGRLRGQVVEGFARLGSASRPHRERLVARARERPRAALAVGGGALLLGVLGVLGMAWLVGGSGEGDVAPSNDLAAAVPLERSDLATRPPDRQRSAAPTAAPVVSPADSSSAIDRAGVPGASSRAPGAEAPSGGVDPDATPGGVAPEATPGGVDAEATPGGVDAEATPGGVDAEATPGGVDAEATPGGVDGEGRSDQPDVAGVMDGAPPLAGEETDLAALLAEAQSQEESWMLTVGERNAVSLYRAVLAIEPENASALAGLARVRGHFVDKATAAEEAGDLAGAVSRLSQARNVLPDGEADGAIAGELDGEIARLRAALAALAAPSSADATPPELAELTPSSGSRVAAGTVSLRGTVASGDLATVTSPDCRCKVEGRTFRCDCVLAAGERRVDLELVDHAGNVAEASVSLHVSRPGRVPAGKTASGLAVYRRSLDGARVVSLPGGSFSMGSEESGLFGSDEKPVREVTISAHDIDEREVTWGQYDRFVEATGGAAPARPGGVDDDHPVVSRTWEEAAAYCDWVGGRLPTEAEWERAARGSQGRRFPWGEEWQDDRANGGAAAASGTVPVGSFPNGASPLGVLDMAGNAAEWVGDWHARRAYADMDDRDPRGPSSGAKRVHRGGSFRVRDGDNLRASRRDSADPYRRFNDVGFRCAADASE